MASVPVPICRLICFRRPVQSDPLAKVRWLLYNTLIEVLGQYNLREKAFRFFAGGTFVRKILRRERFNKEELAYILYGVPASFASAFLLYLAWHAWQGFFGDIWNRLLAYITS